MNYTKPPLRRGQGWRANVPCFSVLALNMRLHKRIPGLASKCVKICSCIWAVCLFSVLPRRMVLGCGVRRAAQTSDTPALVKRGALHASILAQSRNFVKRFASLNRIQYPCCFGKSCAECRKPPSAIQKPPLQSTILNGSQNRHTLTEKFTSF